MQLKTSSHKIGDAKVKISPKNILLHSEHVQVEVQVQVYVYMCMTHTEIICICNYILKYT